MKDARIQVGAFQVGAYNATQGKYQTFDQSDPDIAHAVIASASVPGVFTPVHIGNDQFVDGAVAHVVPVQEILHYWEHNTGDIDILMCYPTHSLQQFLLLCRQVRALDALSGRGATAADPAPPEQMQKGCVQVATHHGVVIRSEDTFH